MCVFLLFLIIAHNSTSFWKRDVIKELLYSSPGRTFYFLSQRSKNFHLEFNYVAVELYECNELSVVAGLTY